MSETAIDIENKFFGKSVVIVMPCYNDWQSLEHLIPEIDSAFSRVKLQIRIIIVDDFSSEELNVEEFLSQTSLETVESISRLRLIRNLGSQRCIAIGIAHASEHELADYLVVADADFQDKPADMPKLVTECVRQKNDQIIFARRTRRSEGALFRS